MLSGISKKKQDPLTEKCEKVNGEIHDINCKVEKIEQDMESNTSTINSLYERLLALERYSRDFNLRFYNSGAHVWNERSSISIRSRPTKKLFKNSLFSHYSSRY